jgi:uncharacterized lipoprotein YehR (DUF1307 family)
MNQSKKFISVLLVMVLALSMLVGCSKKISKDDPILGTWAASEMAGMTKDQLDELGMTFTMTFNDDGTAVANLNGEETSSTWEKDGDNYIVDGDSESKVTIKDGVLSVTVEGEEVKFEKQK